MIVIIIIIMAINNLKSYFIINAIIVTLITITLAIHATITIFYLDNLILAFIIIISFQIVHINHIIL